MSKSKNKKQEPQQNADEKLENNIGETAEELEEEVTEKAEEPAVADTSDEENSEEAEVNGEEDNDEEESESEGSEEPETEEEEEEQEEAVSVIEIPAPVSEEEKKANEEFRKLSLIEKCKKDPLIPVCAILAILALIVAGIYFMLPNAKTPSMGMTLQDFQTRYNNGEVNKSLVNSGADIGFRTPPYVDIKSQPSILGDKEVISASSAYADFFNGPLKYYSIGGIEGATRKSDNMLSYIRVYVLYGEGEGDFNTVWLYASNTLCALYPDLTMYPAMDIAMKAMNEFNGDERYYVRGDYAFRLVAAKKTGDGGIEYVYIVVDVVPRSVLKAEQIREDLDATYPIATASESASETTAATT